MGRIALSIYQFSTLQKCADIIDTAILKMPHFSQVYDDEFDYEKAFDYCKKAGIEVVFDISKAFLENEIEEVKSFIKSHRYSCFLASDLGVCEILSDMDLKGQIIFDSSTMVCNSSDLKLYAKENYRAVSMSSEIPVCDVIHALEDSNIPIFYQVFGEKQMFYSRRKFVSLYKEHRGISFENNDLYLVEEKRPLDKMPIHENQDGYSVFRPYCLSFINEITKLEKLNYLYFESYRLSDETIYEVIQAYKAAINGLISTEDAKNKLQSLGINTKDGFAYSDTAYIKEKIFQ